MVWLRIDDQIAHHPKFIDAGPIASWLWLCGNTYCNKYLTDGFIRESALPTLGSVTNGKKWADVLVQVGLEDLVDLVVLLSAFVPKRWGVVDAPVSDVRAHQPPVRLGAAADADADCGRDNHASRCHARQAS